MFTRRKPYTQIGIRRLYCYRGCGRKAEYQWNVCADGNIWRPLCVECDIELNELVLRWMNDSDLDDKINKYRERVWEKQRKRKA